MSEPRLCWWCDNPVSDDDYAYQEMPFCCTECYVFWSRNQSPDK
jgi:hypothetical protein